MGRMRHGETTKEKKYGWVLMYIASPSRKKRSEINHFLVEEIDIFKHWKIEIRRATERGDWRHNKRCPYIRTFFPSEWQVEDEAHFTIPPLRPRCCLSRSVWGNCAQFWSWVVKRHLGKIVMGYGSRMQTNHVLVISSFSWNGNEC